MEPYFSAKEAIKFGWEKVKEHFWFFTLFSLGIIIIVCLFNVASNSTKETSPVFSALFSIASAVFQIIVGMGYIYIVLQVVRGGIPKAADITKPIHSFWKYIGVSILYALIVLGGIILLVVPGIIWAIRFGLFKYLVIDKPDITMRQALKESKIMTHGLVWRLFLFSVLLGLINIVGVLALFVGLLVTIPLTAIAVAYVYTKLLNRLEPMVQTAQPIVPIQ